MKYKEIKDGYLLRLETGENVNDQLEQFIVDKEIRGAFIQGIGGVQKATVGYYNLKRKKYIFRAVKNAVELVSLQGNIAWFETQPIIHMHAVITNMQNKAYGGHVKNIIVGATVEVRIILSDELIRTPDAEAGLPLLDV
jgi:predicted DNA-binding protein with PD1-like motif